LSLKGSKVSESYLVPGRFVIGRTSDNDLQIESKYVSRHHAQIVTTVEGSSIEDLNSTNGLFVRGKRVRRYKLQEGDVVKLGMHELAYFRAEPPPTATVTLDREDYDADEDEGESAEVEDERDA
jgi:pSer/pThr/pTyr-binding forkhead associated (FHA) protein